MVALPLPPITTLLSETPKFSYSKPFHKSSRKRPNLVSNHNHFWIDSSILFNYSKPLISDHLMHGMVSLFAVCTTPLRVYKRGTTCVSNFIACNKLILCKKVDVLDLLLHETPVADSCERPPPLSDR